MAQAWKPAFRADAVGGVAVNGAGLEGGRGPREDVKIMLKYLTRG